MPTTDVNGNSINFLDTGSGDQAIILLHAFPLSGQMWEGQVESLSDRYRLICPDLKGFGASDAPDDASSYSMDDYAEQVIAVMDAAGVARGVVLGLSMGGYIAFALLRKRPERIGALVLADTRAEADPPEGKEKRSAQQEQVRAQGTAALIDTLGGALLGEPTRTKKPDVVERAKTLMDNPPAGFIGALEAMKNRPDSTEDLVKISVPTLVIVGENDGVTPPDAARKIHEHVGGSRLVVIPDAAHLSNLEAPEAFNGAVAEFLSGL